MKLTSALVVPLIPALSSAAALGRRQNQQGDGPQGGADSTQGDLGGRPAPRFPFPRVEFPVPKETVVLNETMYIYPGQTFDGQMKRYERVEGSCNEQAEGTDADAVFNLMPGATIRNGIPPTLRLNLRHCTNILQSSLDNTRVREFTPWVTRGLKMVSEASTS
jgi:hypothetical protein